MPANQDAVFAMSADGKLLDIKLLDESATRHRSHGALARQVADLSARMRALCSAPDSNVPDKLTEFERRLKERDAQVRDLGEAVATLLESEAARLVRKQEALDERTAVLGSRRPA